MKKNVRKWHDFREPYYNLSETLVIFKKNRWSRITSSFWIKNQNRKILLTYNFTYKSPTSLKWGDNLVLYQYPGTSRTVRSYTNCLLKKKGLEYTCTHRHSDTQTLRHTDTQTYRHTDTNVTVHTGTYTTDTYIMYVGYLYST